MPTGVLERQAAKGLRCGALLRCDLRLYETKAGRVAKRNRAMAVVAANANLHGIGIERGKGSSAGK